MIDVNSIMKRCVDIVLQSGEIVREHWRQPSNVRHKGSIDLVTETDLTVETFLKEKLADLGPQASFLLSERNEFDVKNAETFEFGVAGGLGFNITKNFFLQGRYVLGLTEATKEAKVKNSVVQISAGFTF